MNHPGIHRVPTHGGNVHVFFRFCFFFFVVYRFFLYFFRFKGNQRPVFQTGGLNLQAVVRISRWCPRILVVWNLNIVA